MGKLTPEQLDATLKDIRQRMFWEDLKRARDEENKFKLGEGEEFNFWTDEVTQDPAFL